jgi:hypothetical protein
MRNKKGQYEEFQPWALSAQINSIWDFIENLGATKQAELIKEISDMVGELEALQAQVAETIRVEGEALTALQADVTQIADLAAQLAAAQSNNVTAQQLADMTASLKTATDALTPAAEANTTANTATP